MKVKLEIKSDNYLFLFFFQNKHVCLFYCAVTEGNHSSTCTYCKTLDPSIIQDSKHRYRKDSEESTSIKKKEVCAEFSSREQKQTPPGLLREELCPPVSWCFYRAIKAGPWAEQPREEKAVTQKGAPGLRAWLLLPDSSWERAGT